VRHVKLSHGVQLPGYEATQAETYKANVAGTWDNMSFSLLLVCMCLWVGVML